MDSEDYDYGEYDNMNYSCDPLICECFDQDQDYFLENLGTVVGGYVSISISIFGIIANILAVAVFSTKSFRSNFNNLLISLGVCDLLFLMLSILECLRRYFQDQEAHHGSVVGRMTQVHHYLYPHILFPLHNILLTISIFMTISISIERYLAIFHPLVYRNR